MEQWPSDLPHKVLRRDYRQGLGNNVTKFETSAGPSKRRKRW